MRRLIAIVLGAGLFSLCLFFVTAVLWIDSTEIVSASGVNAAQRHHSEVRWHNELRHARDVRSARHWWWERAASRVNNHYFDMRTVRTRDWRCIRLLEEGMAQAPRNMFGFVPFTPMPAGEQDALALRILRTAGWGAWSTAPACRL